jgi:hypothetical protein
VLPPKRERGDINLTLKTQDILGATAGSKGLGVFAEAHKRREVRGVNRTDDIDGAQAGSLKKGTQTKRFTSPLDPHYQYLGHTELVDPCSAYSRPKEEPARRTTIQQNTAKETLKKATTVGLDVIPENESSAKLEVNKLYQASRDVRFKEEHTASAVNVVTAP